MEAVVTMQTQDRSPAPGFGELNCFQFDFEIVGDQLQLSPRYHPLTGAGFHPVPICY